MDKNLAQELIRIQRQQLAEMQLTNAHLSAIRTNAQRLSAATLADLSDPTHPQNTEDKALPAHMTAQEVADYLGKNRSSLYRGTLKAELKPYKHIGCRPYYLQSDVIEFMKKHLNKE